MRARSRSTPSSVMPVPPVVRAALIAGQGSAWGLRGRPGPARGASRGSPRPSPPRLRARRRHPPRSCTAARRLVGDLLAPGREREVPVQGDRAAVPHRHHPGDACQPEHERRHRHQLVGDHRPHPAVGDARRPDVAAGQVGRAPHPPVLEPQVHVGRRRVAVTDHRTERQRPGRGGEVELATVQPRVGTVVAVPRPGGAPAPAPRSSPPPARARRPPSRPPRPPARAARRRAHRPPAVACSPVHCPHAPLPRSRCAQPPSRWSSAPRSRPAHRSTTKPTASRSHVASVTPRRRTRYFCTRPVGVCGSSATSSM